MTETRSSRGIRRLRRLHAILNSAFKEMWAEAEAWRPAAEEAAKGDIETLVEIGEEFVDLADGVQGNSHKVLLVALASHVEVILKAHVKQHDPQAFAHLRNLANWRELVGAVESLYQVKLETLPGYQQAELARMLANAFKHGDGWLTGSPKGGASELERWAQDPANQNSGFSFAAYVHNGKIDYGQLPLATYIDQVELFLNALEQLDVPHRASI